MLRELRQTVILMLRPIPDRVFAGPGASRRTCNSPAKSGSSPRRVMIVRKYGLDKVYFPMKAPPKRKNRITKRPPTGSANGSGKIWTGSPQGPRRLSPTGRDRATKGGSFYSNLQRFITIVHDRRLRIRFENPLQDRIFLPPKQARIHKKYACFCRIIQIDEKNGRFRLYKCLCLNIEPRNKKQR